MTILITGGAGFIGSHFIIEWFKHHHEPIINLDTLNYAANPTRLEHTLPVNCPYILVPEDIQDITRIAELMHIHNIRAIIHFAAETDVDRSLEHPATFVKNNTLGTLCLLDAVTGYWRTLDGDTQKKFRFIHISTDEVFGTLGPDDPPFVENNIYAPNNPYAASKAGSDHIVRSFHVSYGLPTITLHCSNNYGPGQYPEKLIPRTIYNALKEYPILVYGDGKQIRDWLYVEDHVRAIREVLAHSPAGETYNVGSRNEQRNIDVIHMLCAILDKKKPRLSGSSYTDLITHTTDRLGHDTRYAINPHKIEQTLGWHAYEDFYSGLEKTVDWHIARSHV